MSRTIPKKCCINCHYLKDTRDGDPGSCIPVSKEGEVGRDSLRQGVINGNLQDTTSGGISRSYGCYKGVWGNNWIQEIPKRRHRKMNMCNMCFYPFTPNRQMSIAKELQNTAEENCKSCVQIAILIVAVLTLLLTGIMFLKSCSNNEYSNPSNTEPQKTIVSKTESAKPSLPQRPLIVSEPHHNTGDKTPSNENNNTPTDNP